jgi:hypothetical protein
MESSAILTATLRRTVEAMLSARFGARVRIAGVQDFPYSRVARCALESAGGVAPGSVVVRVPRDDPTRSGLARLDNERAALEFLSSIGNALAPRFYAGGAAAGVLVSEDLDAHPSLLDLLLGDDEAAARQGLLAFARGLGRLHAQTAGRAVAYDERRARLCLVGAGAKGLSAQPPVAESWRLVQDAVARLGLPPPRGVDDDIGEIVRILTAPGPYLALSSGDPSVVNCKVANGAVRFFDFEEAGFRHAFIDAAVLSYLYPTGGPPWRLPRAAADPIEPAYREELARACSAALDDADYERGMAAASAAWTILRMARLPRVDAGPDRDSWPLVPAGWTAPIPTRSRRRQLVAIVEAFIASARRAGALEALVAWCDGVVAALQARWPEATEELPLYPAFAARPGATDQ